MNSLRISYDVTVEVDVDEKIQDKSKLMALAPYLSCNCDNGEVRDKYLAHIELVDAFGEPIREWST
jgi:hypothetical protein